MALVGGPMFFSNNYAYNKSWEFYTFTSAKMNMHSNSHDIQQKDDDCVPMTAWLSHNKQLIRTKNA